MWRNFKQFFFSIQVSNALWIETKLRGHLKALITKLFKETFKVAWLMTQGIVTSLEIIGLSQWIGNRGSKSDSFISVKEQRVDGFSISTRYCKVYSKCRRNSVFLHNSNNVMLNQKSWAGQLRRPASKQFLELAPQKLQNPYFLVKPLLS